MISASDRSRVRHLGANHTDRLAKEILKCDDVILGVLVTDLKGKVLSFVESERIPEAFKERLKNMERHAKQVAVMLAAVGQGDQQVGAAEFVIINFKNMKLLLIPFPEHGISVAVGLPRSALGERIYDFVIREFGGRKDFPK